MEILILCMCAVIIVLTIAIIIKINQHSNMNDSMKSFIDAIIGNFNKLLFNEGSKIIQNQDYISKSISESIKNFQDSQYKLGQLNNSQIEKTTENLKSEMNNFKSTVYKEVGHLSDKFHNFSLENEQKLENIRHTISETLNKIQYDNNKKLDDMRLIVDQKLEKTINQRMTESFKLVNERLQDVYKGLGEMQNLAQGVGDLKKILSNVKSRGIVGEIQLGAILEEILSPEQYVKNFMLDKSFVEYAIKIPSNNSFIYLPIDSKFPGDTYSNLCDAYQNGDADGIQKYSKLLIDVIKREAKDIRDKYIRPPITTEFAIMFLPFEGLYAEVINKGMIEILQRDFHVNIAGPSTMAALLNSLHMGFRSFAIQKRSNEVWKVLENVKSEFDNFAVILDKTKQRLNQATDELDKLVGVRTRKIQNSLRDVAKINDDVVLDDVLKLK